MDMATFLIRHTPFWCIPLSMICAELARMFYWRGSKGMMWLMIGPVFVSTCLLGLYFWAGDPEKAVQLFLEIIYYLTE